ncbi:class I SAM-dependent methyltransferase [Thermodesulfobacteriota bacterium]
MNNIRATSFDSIARVYEKTRPGYPQEVYDEIESHIPFSPTTKILEIGAGDGKATWEMHQRWHSQLTALEPGSSFCDLLREKFRGTDKVRVVNTTFEDFAVEDLFDCIVAATAFHWVDKNTGY